MHVVIGGYGRVGRSLAHVLESQGHTVAVIDRSEAAFEEFDEIRGRKLTGEAFDRETLEHAGIKKADVYCAVTSGDNSNFISARIAKEHYGVRTVIARIYEPRRAEIYRDLGIGTCSSVDWSIAQMLAMIETPGLRSGYRYGAGQVEMVDFEAPDHLVGKSAAALDVPGEVRLAVVVRGREAFIPPADYTIERGDRLHVDVAAASAEKLQRIVRGEGEGQR